MRFRWAIARTMHRYTSRAALAMGVASVTLMAGCDSKSDSEGEKARTSAAFSAKKPQRVASAAPATPSAVAETAKSSEESPQYPEVPPASFKDGAKVDIAQATGLGCQAKAKEGWVQLLCRKRNGTGGHPVRAIRDLEAFEAEQEAKNGAGAAAPSDVATAKAADQAEPENAAESAPPTHAASPPKAATSSDAVAAAESGESARSASVPALGDGAGGQLSANADAGAPAPPNVVLADENGELRVAAPWREGYAGRIRVEWSNTHYDLDIKSTEAKLVLPVRLVVRRECEKLRRASLAVVKAAKTREGESQLSAADALKLPRFGICKIAGLGAWALSLEALEVRGQGSMRELSADLSLKHLDPNGGIVSAPYGKFDFAPQGLSMKHLMVYDYDDDGSDEVIVRYDLLKIVNGSKPTARPGVFTFKNRSIRPYSKLGAMAPGSVSVEQLDFDMRPDVADYGPYTAWLEEDCGAKACPGRITGPQFFRHALAGGAFSATDKAATDAIKRLCGKPPASVVAPQGKSVNAKRTAKLLGCAKALGVEEQKIRAELDQKASAICSGADDCPLLGILRKWASQAQ